jgi:hypothetical protein
MKKMTRVKINVMLVRCHMFERKNFDGFNAADAMMQLLGKVN